MTVHRIITGLPPLNISVGLVVQVPTRHGDAVGQGQCHARVVRPFPGFETVRAAVSVACNGNETAWGFELDGSSQGIAHSQSDQSSSAAVFHGKFFRENDLFLVHFIASLSGASEKSEPALR